MSEEKILIKYIVIGDLDSSKYVTEFSTNNLDSKVKKDSSHIFAKICKTAERKFDERNKISAGDNSYYFTLSQPNIVFLIYADNSCPERVVFAMVEEIKNENVLSMINEETKELNPSGKQKLKEIVDKYQDKDKVDKIASIQEDVNAIKVDMKKNIDKMVDSVEDAEKLQNQAEALKEASKDYKDNAQEIKKITCWQNFKLWIILIGICLLVVGLILFFIFK